jgi:DNA-binding PucR family transcriptional regulator
VFCPVGLPRGLRSGEQVADRDGEDADRVVARTLGQLADADRELRDTLCVCIGEQFSAARAARALYAHRSTVFNRLHRAGRLLPLPLADHGLEVGVALEIVQWPGTTAALPVTGGPRTP